MNKTKKIIMIIVITITLLALIGGTYAYWRWQLAAANRTTITLTYADGFSCTADGGGDITSSNVQLIPASCTNSNYAIKRTVTVTPTLTSANQLSLNLKLKIDNISTILANSDNFKYALTKSSSSCTSDVFAEGTFKGKQNGDTVDLLTEKQYLVSEPDTYYLYIWLDRAETNNATMDQPFRFSLTGDCTNQDFDRYTVTFDANGGTVNMPTKEVAYGSKYGSLPIPTREGYTFLGWNGKNLLGEAQIGIAWNNSSNSARAVAYAKVKPNTQYTISFNNISGVDGVYSFEKNDKNENTVIGEIPQINDNKTIITTANTNYIGIQFNKSNITASDIEVIKMQVEEGNTAITYEPYYITSDTTVVQEKNHTLTAIWQKN